jgi:hypothetical protein
MIIVEPKDLKELEQLMDSAAYAAMVGEATS